MCGIFGYIGHKSNAIDLVLRGLKKLEYRGYDSAGVATIFDNKLKIFKKKGKIADLEAFLVNKENTNFAIGHTRWATHGVPNDINAHPHLSMNNKFALVHNGIIENYNAIKEKLISIGYKFKSDTDTEVFVNLIESIYLNLKCDFDTAVKLSLKEVVGAYGICVLCIDEPDKIIACRNGSPLVIGIGDKEFFISSDANSFAEHTKNAIYLEDGEIVFLNYYNYGVTNADNVIIPKEIEELELDISKIEKGKFPHFMLKEIYEQPEIFINCIRGRVDPKTNTITLGGMKDVLHLISQAKKIIICGCGTSWHAGLIGEYLIEKFARIPVEVEYSSEFRYRDAVLEKDDVVFVISQSGETADTLAALREAKRRNILTIGICNVVGSSIARETVSGIFTHAGPEIGVASTKAFISQVTALILISLVLAEKRKTISKIEFANYIAELVSIPQKIKLMLDQNENILNIAKQIKDATNVLYLGRGINFPVALEGALKLKEISYIHAEGYPAAEMKHGPIALIDENMPVIIIAIKDALYDKIISNIQEILSRNGKVIAIISEDDTEIPKFVQNVIKVPKTLENFSVFLTTIPLQLLAYHIATLKGCNVDQPRNLAKSVTVE